MNIKITGGLKKIFAGIALFSLELVITLILFIGSLISFILLVNRIFRIKNNDFDNKAFELVSPYISKSTTRLMEFITIFGTADFLIAANTLLMAYFLFFRKHKWYSIKIPVVAIGSVSIMMMLKLFFSRPRPSIPLVKEVYGFSFPSGHAMCSVTFYGLLVFLVWENVQNKMVKSILIIGLLLFILIIGFSRVYLRVHYASDVLAGFSMGLIWLVLSIWVMGFIENYTRKEIAPALSTNNSLL